MVELSQSQFPSVRHFLSGIKCDIVFGYSIVENRQRGRVFADDLNHPQTVLFWHYCGFAFVGGRHDNRNFNQTLGEFLRGTYEQDQRRISLFVNDTAWNKVIQQFIKDNPNIKIGELLRFHFNEKAFRGMSASIPDGYTLREMDEELIEKLQGHVIPSFSWHSSEAFLKGGKGYCLLDGGRIACNAFSASIGNQILDIGIETMADYRMKGLAVPAAYAMVKYCLDNGFKPNWGCTAINIGSARIAARLGFEVLDSHPVYSSP